MIYFRYDSNGFCTGFVNTNGEEPQPAGTTPLDPGVLGVLGVSMRYARLVNGAWVEDHTKADAEDAARAVAAVDAVVTKILDKQSQAWGYDDIKSAVGYAEEPMVPQYQAEGRALRAWRSVCWSARAAAPPTVTPGNHRRLAPRCAGPPDLTPSPRGDRSTAPEVNSDEHRYRTH